jgi:dTDP-4-dehydrorhamnose 3,5-epimerase
MIPARDSDLPGVVMITPSVFRDTRGYFRETWREREYAALGLPSRFVQDNVSCSFRGVLRGMHMQFPGGQGKLISVLQGEVFDVAVDLRTDSSHYRAWTAERLSSENGCQLYIPPGFAHGFLVLSEVAVVSYKCTELYAPGSELTIRWDDPDLAIDWPITSPIMSEKDRAAPLIADLRPEQLPSIGRV